MKTCRQAMPGVLLVAAISALAYALTGLDAAVRYGVGSLTLAIVIGALLGNAVPQLGGGAFRHGLSLAQRYFLRAGVALFGFNLSLQQIIEIGAAGVLVDVVMVVSTLAMGWFLGRRVLNMHRDTVLLVAAGSAICGAAAVVATVPVLGLKRGEDAEKTALAVASVVLFGTLAMFVYPLIYAWLGAAHFDFGIYVGSTVHEVAQVVAIGTALGEEVGYNAVIAKMIRVMLLVPFLLIVATLVARRIRREAAQTGVAEPAVLRQPITLPWFALCFIAIAGLNSLAVLPEPLVAALRLTGILLLTTAMAALGIDTNIRRMGQAGLRPLLLGAGLFAHLILTGGLVNWLMH